MAEASLRPTAGDKLRLTRMDAGVFRSSAGIQLGPAAVLNLTKVLLVSAAERGPLLHPRSLAHGLSINRWSLPTLPTDGQSTLQKNCTSDPESGLYTEINPVKP